MLTRSGVRKGQLDSGKPGSEDINATYAELKRTNEELTREIGGKENSGNGEKKTKKKDFGKKILTKKQLEEKVEKVEGLLLESQEEHKKLELEFEEYKKTISALFDAISWKMVDAVRISNRGPKE